MKTAHVFVNLKGEPVDIARLWSEGAESRRLLRAAGVVNRKPTVKKGYAAPPGTGPEGETCKNCAHKHSFGRSGGGGKTFIKCELRRPTWTSGAGTDILAGSPACNKFERAST